MDGVYQFEKYDLVVSWDTVRLMMSLRINQGWATMKLNFSNYFVQATLVEDVYLTLPYYLTLTLVNQSKYGHKS